MSGPTTSDPGIAGPLDRGRGVGKVVRDHLMLVELGDRDPAVGGNFGPCGFKQQGPHVAHYLEPADYLARIHQVGFARECQRIPGIQGLRGFHGSTVFNGIEALDDHPALHVNNPARFRQSRIVQVLEQLLKPGLIKLPSLGIGTDQG